MSSKSKKEKIAQKIKNKEDITVLVVDNDEDIRADLKDILTENNYEVAQAGTGGKALKKIDEDFFNLVILDSHLPDMDGIELARKVKNKSEKTEMLILTGNASLENAIEAVKEDIYQYLTKPVEPEKLIEAVKSALEKQFLVIENRRLMENLKETNEKYRELSKFKDGVISMISHDLRSPISSIRGFHKSLLAEHTGKLTDMQKEIIETEAEAVDSMMELINNILDMRQIEAGEFRVDKEPVNLKEEVIDTLVKRLGPQIKDGDFNLKVNYNTDLEKVEIDGGRVRQVIQNLLQNAFKFTPKGGEITIEVTRPDEDYLQVSIQDTGKGMDKETQSTIFKAFYTQDDEKREKSKKGRGLGLSICKEIINAHGGRIWAESEGEGKGSDFKFKIPINREEKKEKRGQTPKSNEEETVQEDKKDQKIKVLVVDDEQTIRITLQFILEDNDYIVEVAADGREALEKIDEQFFNIAVLDYRLPDIDGIELARKVKEKSEETEILILTGNASLESAIEAVKEDIYEYLTKPIEPEELIDVIESATEKQFLIMENKRLMENLKKSNEKYRRLNKFKDGIISMISHDLRSPISSIRGFHKSLLAGHTGELTDMQKEIVETEEEAVDSMMELINNILDMRQIEAGEFNVEREPTDFEEDVINALVKRLAPQIEERDLNLEVNYSADIKKVEIDGGRIRQVVQNLLQNAFKFTPKGGDITINVTQPEEDYIRVSVEDTGKGMNKETLNTIFEAFYTRDDEKREKNKKGRGLGLSICKEIVNAHGGRIWAESEGEGEGSSFKFDLPVKDGGKDS
ncbi:MAG: ATP-binding protein [Elusimicrobiota bacterium]